MIRAAVILLAGLTAGCASHQAARNYAIGGVVADTVSTHYALERGCIEGNPLYGNDADIRRVAVVNLAFAGLLWWLSDYMQEKGAHPWPIWAVGTLRYAVAIRNTQQDCQ